MFGNKIKEAEATIVRQAAVIVALGLSADATPEQATAHAAASAQAIDAAVAPLNAQIETLTKANTEQAATIAAHGTEVAGIRAALESAGVRIAADAPLNAEAIKAAVDTRVAANAAKVIAGAGHEALAIPTQEAAAEVDAADTVPATAAEFLAANRAIKDPGARTTHFRKHRARFGLN